MRRLEGPPEDVRTGSKNMIVRGGASGKESASFLLSLRGQLEMEDRKDEVGFRPALVPVPEEEK